MLLFIMAARLQTASLPMDHITEIIDIGIGAGMWAIDMQSMPIGSIIGTDLLPD